MNYTVGPSLGLVKPVFLEVFKYDFSGELQVLLLKDMILNYIILIIFMAELLGQLV